MRAALWSVALGLVIVSAGCENTPPTLADDIDPDSPDAGLVTRDLPDTGALEPAPADAAAANTNRDIEALLACALDEPCPKPEVQFIEGDSYFIPVDQVTCVMNALAARAPGRYRYLTESAYGNGGVETEHVLVVTSNGSVIYGRKPDLTVLGLTEEESHPGSDPARRCRLKPASFFEGCVSQLQPSTSESAVGEDCAFGDGGSFMASQLPWFEACEEQSPARCE
jgi:hypothetical protein